MRIRNKPWAAPELNACPFFLREPERQKGRWNEWFAQKQPIHLELGCGKGWFLAGLAPKRPGVNFIGIDLKDAVLAPGKRLIEAAFREAGVPLQNVALTAYNIERLMNIMDERDEVERIYINFCNPWPRVKHHKRRLTHPRRLADYRRLLAPGGELWFKTDDAPLFADTLGYLGEAGYEVLRQTRDLHAEDCPGNVMTEHEKMFSEKGIPIQALIARPLPERN